MKTDIKIAPLTDLCAFAADARRAAADLLVHAQRGNGTPEHVLARGVACLEALQVLSDEIDARIQRGDESRPFGDASGPSLVARVDQLESLAARASAVLDMSIERLHNAQSQSSGPLGIDRETDALAVVAGVLRELEEEVQRVHRMASAAARNVVDIKAAAK